MMRMYIFFRRSYKIQNKIRVVKKVRGQVTRVYMTNTVSADYVQLYAENWIFCVNTQIYVESMLMKKAWL